MQQGAHDKCSGGFVMLVRGYMLTLGKSKMYLTVKKGKLRYGLIRFSDR